MWHFHITKTNKNQQKDHTKNQQKYLVNIDIMKTVCSAIVKTDRFQNK